MKLEFNSKAQYVLLGLKHLQKIAMVNIEWNVSNKINEGCN